VPPGGSVEILIAIVSVSTPPIEPNDEAWNVEVHPSTVEWPTIPFREAIAELATGGSHHTLDPKGRSAPSGRMICS
jgi:hypothetical protein